MPKEEVTTVPTLIR